MEIYNDTYCVYIHTNKINGKKYVGVTGRIPEKRWNDGRGYKTCTFFYHAIQKYGWDSFEHEIIASNLTKEEAGNFEKLLIKKLNTTDSNYGYNLTHGGYDGKPSDVTRRKQSESHKGKYVGDKHHMYGKHLSEETKKKISEARKGVSPTNKGKPMTKEQQDKLVESHIGKCCGKDNPHSKSVCQYGLNGELIKIWDYIKQASNELNIDNSQIVKCCKRKEKTAGGYYWKYTEVD